MKIYGGSFVIVFLSFKPLGCLSHHSFWHLCNKGALEPAWLEVKAEIHMTLRAGVLQKQENQTLSPHQLTSWHFDILHQQHNYSCPPEVLQPISQSLLSSAALWDAFEMKAVLKGYPTNLIRKIENTKGKRAPSGNR